MLKRLITSVMGTRHERERKRIQPIVDEINEHYARLQTVSESELCAQTEKFRGIIREHTAEIESKIASLREAKRTAADPAERERIDGELSGADGRGGLEGALREATAEVLDEILPEAFATVREGARRLLGTTAVVTGHEQPWDMVHYDVQLMGGIQLHLGKIAEMATGEGKTLVATLPLYLNALPGKGAHLVTVNSYLARRDSQWMGHLYRYLGLTVACLDDTEPGTPERRAAYASDITYGTNNEFGFDYLRDNMVPSLDQRVQRGHHYAIVDEVDSVLIDEARTPLIISGPVGGENDLQYRERRPPEPLPEHDPASRDRRHQHPLQEPRLPILHHRDRRYCLRVGARKLLLIAVEDATQNQARKHQCLPTSHLRNVNHAELALGERMNQHIHELAASIVQHPHDRGHVCTGRQCLSLLPV